MTGLELFHCAATNIGSIWCRLEERMTGRYGTTRNFRVTGELRKGLVCYTILLQAEFAIYPRGRNHLAVLAGYVYIALKTNFCQLRRGNRCVAAISSASRWCLCPRPTKSESTPNSLTPSQYDTPCPQCTAHHATNRSVSPYSSKVPIQSIRLSAEELS